MAAEHIEISRIINNVLQSNNQARVMQLLLDCTVLPEVVSAVQTFGQVIRDRLLYLGRTWCYNIHRERMNQLGLLDYR